MVLFILIGTLLLSAYDIGHILSELCKRKGVEIIAAECTLDHVHMSVSILPKYSVSEIMEY